MSHTLVLNSNYVAISIIPLRKAIKLLYKGRCEVVEVEGGYYSSYDFNSWAELSSFKELSGVKDDDDYIFIGDGKKIGSPSIIRTLFYNGVAYEKVKLTRKNIYLRDDYTCAYCGKKLKPDKLNIDHVIPKSRGGRNTWTNVVCSCFPCNTKKNDNTPDEANMKLRRKPFEPKYNILLNYSVSSQEKYLKKWSEFVNDLYYNVELK